MLYLIFVKLLTPSVDVLMKHIIDRSENESFLADFYTFNIIAHNKYIL